MTPNNPELEAVKAKRKGGYVAASKYLIISYYGKSMRAAPVDDLQSVWAATEHELTHGATKVEILVSYKHQHHD